MTATKLFPDAWKPVEQELRTFIRALPQLLNDGGQNKHVIVRGDAIDRIFDKYPEASEYAHDTFQDGKYIIQKIDERMLTAMAPYLDATEASIPMSHRQEVA